MRGGHGLCEEHLLPRHRLRPPCAAGEGETFRGSAGAMGSLGSWKADLKTLYGANPPSRMRLAPQAAPEFPRPGSGLSARFNVSPPFLTNIFADLHLPKIKTLQSFVCS